MPCLFIYQFEEVQQLPPAHVLPTFRLLPPIISSLFTLRRASSFFATWLSFLYRVSPISIFAWRRSRRRRRHFFAISLMSLLFIFRHQAAPVFAFQRDADTPAAAVTPLPATVLLPPRRRCAAYARCRRFRAAADLLLSPRFTF